jgi:DNA-directed RNA polymerase subunit M/transcription elongation factor TFIIS
MCALCKRVMDNNTYHENECSNCGSLDMADPNEHNDEWAYIYRLQNNNKKLRYKKDSLNTKYSILKSFVIECSEKDARELTYYDTENLIEKAKDYLNKANNYKRAVL